MSEDRKIQNDIVAVVLLTGIIFLVACLATYDKADPVANAFPALNQFYQPDQLVYPQNEAFSNACGRMGAWTADLLVHVLGVGAYFLVVGLVSLEIALFRQTTVKAPFLKTIGWMLSLLGIVTLGSMTLPEWTVSPIIGAGGYLGALSRGLAVDHFGWVGGLLVAACVSLIGVMMWTEYLIFRAGRLAFSPALVAATSVLPFGFLHRVLSWVNSQSDEEHAFALDDEEYDEDGDEDTGAPLTIRINGDHVDEDSDTVTDEPVEEETEDSFDEEIEGLDEEEVEEELPAAMVSEDDEESWEEAEDEIAASASVAPKPHFPIKKPVSEPVKSERDEVMSQLDEAADMQSDIDYEMPTLDMLIEGDAVPFEAQKLEALEKAKILEKTCKEFGYQVQVVEVETGPVISQYEIQLEAGLRLNKITALADDLAIALRVTSVRIVAPIPGKNTVGIEVPNESRQMVRLREVMQQCEAKTKRMNIPLFLGKDAIGAPMVIDLAKMPHLLIAGRTGTGKSVCLNAIISSILMTRRPDEVRMLMIDPKMVELSGYGRLPHLMHPVVTDMKKAEAILAWAVEKMEDRYRLLAKAGVRHINSYNQLGEEELIDRLKPKDQIERDNIPGNLPYIVIVADEMADLMMTAGKEVEQHIIRLAQKSRAVGIHLILATQKPTVDVITGLIKSNLPARLAFQVASKMDSRVVLDSMGAEKLLGSGDMLFLWPGTSNLLRGQGTFLTDEEIDLVTDAVSTGEQNFVSELVNMKVDSDGGESGIGAIKSRDDLYEQAVDTVVSEQRGSVSLLQRALGIGYGRAARLVDYMEEDGFVGPYNGSKSREVLLTAERWVEIQNGENGKVDVASKTSAPSLLKVDTTRQTLMAANQAASPVLEETVVVEDDEECEGEEYADEDYDAEDEDAVGVDRESVSVADEADDTEEEYEEEDDVDYCAEGEAGDEYEEYEEEGEEEYEDYEEEEEYEDEEYEEED